MQISGGVFEHARAAMDNLRAAGFDTRAGSFTRQNGRLWDRAWLYVAASGKAVVTIDIAEGSDGTR